VGRLTLKLQHPHKTRNKQRLLPRRKGRRKSRNCGSK